MNSVMKRPISCLEVDSAAGSSKYPRMSVIRLESDSSEMSGDESLQSFQLLDTASAHDTSDTSSKSEESEYELASLSEGEVPEISSGPDDVVVVGDFATLVEEFGSDISVVADLSDSHSTSGDSEIGKADYWKCVKCGTTNKRPYFRFCLKCFRERKSFLPPRPKSRRRRRDSPSVGSSEGPASYDSGLGLSQSSQHSHDDLSERSDSLSEPKCSCCMESPVNGIFLHGDIAHQIYCYKCSQRVWMERKHCPYCNQLVSKVVKVFRADIIGGVLLVVANYTGDCLNFGLAAELAKKDGIKVETVIVADDCALLSKGKLSVAGRRGMCGLAFVYKIAGQQAAEGASLAQVADTANRLAQSMATMGLATAPCTLPGTTTPLFTLEPGFVELGLGVHGEAGTEKIKIAPASELMKEILLPTVETLHLEKGNKIAIIVNNLGALTQLEQFVITGIVRKKFESMGITVCRLYSGLVMTSLEMVGVQVCVLNLSSPNANPDDWLRWLDSSTSAPAWPGCASSVPSISEPEVPEVPEDEVEEHHDLGPKLRAEVASVLKAAIVAASEAVISHSEKLNELDSGCGDGDCGSTLARLAREILSTISTLKFEFPARLLLQLASMASTTMGGTSGAVYGLLFSAASHELREIEQGTAGKDLHEAIIKAWHSGLQGIMRYSAARVGDRTLLDSLVPAFEAFAKSMKNGEGVATALKKALNAAKEGCESTATMEARAGRASYVNKAHLVSVDAGAFGVVVWLEKLVLELVKKL